jgi:predicted ester cyclase
MSIESTRAVMTRYIESEHSDVSMLADDVVFRHMASGDEHHGPQAVLDMLHYMYRTAFDAHAETRNVICGESNAVYEAEFVGRHVGEFAGIAPTGKEVRVPLCVVYDLEHDKIVRARVYLEMPVLFAQIGQPPAR